jgi:hypothetical protein
VLRLRLPAAKSATQHSLHRSSVLLWCIGGKSDIIDRLFHVYGSMTESRSRKATECFHRFRIFPKVDVQGGLFPW